MFNRYVIAISLLLSFYPISQLYPILQQRLAFIDNTVSAVQFPTSNFNTNNVQTVAIAPSANTNSDYRF